MQGNAENTKKMSAAKVGGALEIPYEDRNDMETEQICKV